MQDTPKGLRLQIAIFGRRNVGKSSLLNCITGQNVSIVSPVAGTTTDPVEKPMELLPLGPVLFIDTAGIDDIGDLGKLRTEKSIRIFERADIVILVTEADRFGKYERQILEETEKRELPVLVVLNKKDVHKTPPEIISELEERKIPYLHLCATDKKPETTVEIREKLIEIVPSELIKPIPAVADLVEKDQIVMLVVPIDKQAPKGRLILPQQMILREILDKKAIAVVVNEQNLAETLGNIKKKPSLVITDSQVFRDVFKNTPEDIPVTSFSILLAKSKGDIKEFTAGIKRAEKLKDGSRILIAEACTHHPIGDDIGRIKIPGWLREKTGRKLNFDIYCGHDYPENLSGYDLIIHCGSCMLNRKETLSRIYSAKKAGIPITNYGLIIAWIFGGLKRALAPIGLENTEKEKSYV